jgi:hypothetical protein
VVEHHLAKVGVAGSNPVSRSLLKPYNTTKYSVARLFLFQCIIKISFRLQGSYKAKTDIFIFLLLSFLSVNVLLSEFGKKYFLNFRFKPVNL